MSDKCWEFIGINGAPVNETFGRADLVIRRPDGFASPLSSAHRDDASWTHPLELETRVRQERLTLFEEPVFVGVDLEAARGRCAFWIREPVWRIQEFCARHNYGATRIMYNNRYYHVMIINESESADVLRMCVETVEGFALPILRELAEDREFLKNVEYSCKHMRKYHPEWFSEDEDVQD